MITIYNNKYRLLYNIFFLLVFVLLFAIAGFRPVDVTRDSEAYARAIQSFIITHNYDFISIEPSFYLIVDVSKFLFNDVVRGVFILYAFLGVSLTLYAIKKNSSFPLLSLIVFSCSYFVLHEMTQIRVALAAAIFLLAIPDIVNRNLKSFLMKTALAMLFHYSAITMLFTYLLGSKTNTNKTHAKIFYLFLPIIGILLGIFNVEKFFLPPIISILPKFLSYKYNIYSNLYKLGMFNRIRVFDTQYLGLLIIYYFAIININKFKKETDVLDFKILGWMFFIFYFFWFFPVIGGRISEFLGIVSILALPSLISIIREKFFMYSLVVFSSFLMLYNIIVIHKLIAF
jgi:hypothetical protein